ncbi:MAG TPA: magnesium transporter, partial [Thioalkalivibrio sp.]|nr:magnesium transporter [Thioalkalivibrio sp.]
DDAAALLDELPDEHTELLMEMLPAEDQQVLQARLTYPEDSAGRLMTPEFITVRSDWTVGQALDHVRDQHDVGETVNMVFVISDQGRVLGTLSLRELLLARPSNKIHDIGHGDVISIGTDEDQEEAARMIRHYDLEVLPVVDEQGVMRGIITVDDILDVVEEETTEDFQKMGSVGVVGLSMKEASAGLLYQKRIGWLVILVVVNVFSGAAIALFEAAIEAVVALVFFLPLVIASGGNAGAQSSTLMVRALATGDVQARDWLKLWGKELLVSTALGITLGLAVWGAGIWLGGLDVGLAVAISMVLVVVMASMFGMVLPFALERFGLDPASASAPLITSVADVFGVLIYFSVATALLL